VAALSVAEVVPAEQAPRLLRVVVRDGRLEALALRGRLPQLPAEPAEEAHRLLVDRPCHRCQLRGIRATAVAAQGR